MLVHNCTKYQSKQAGITDTAYGANILDASLYCGELNKA